MVRISEVFASQQFEGREVGRTTIFVRFLVCNMSPRCDWCDVKNYQGKEMSIKEIVNKIKEWKNIRHVTFTGGEPTLFWKNMIEIMKHLRGYKFAIETNGLIPSNPTFFTTMSVSPKKQNINPETIRFYKDYENVIFKFVVEGEKSYNTWRDFVKLHGIDKEKVYMMPEGRDPKDLIVSSKWLAKKCINDGFNMSTRVQYLLYGRKKSV